MQNNLAFIFSMIVTAWYIYKVYEILTEEKEEKMDPYIEIALQAVMVALDTEKSDDEKKQALEMLNKKKAELDEKYKKLFDYD